MKTFALNFSTKYDGVNLWTTAEDIFQVFLVEFSLIDYWDCVSVIQDSCKHLLDVQGPFDT